MRIISLWYGGNRRIFPIFSLLNRFSLRIIRLKERHTLLDNRGGSRILKRGGGLRVSEVSDGKGV